MRTFVLFVTLDCEFHFDVTEMPNPTLSAFIQQKIDALRKVGEPYTVIMDHDDCLETFEGVW